MPYSPPMAETEPDNQLMAPEEFLDQHHPANDDYMRSVDHIQRKLMHAASKFRRKQVNMLKCAFAGHNYTDTAKRVGTHPSTVSKVVNSKQGQEFLSLMQYHQTTTSSWCKS